MKALLINAVCGIRSTGRICTDLAKELESEGYEVKIAYGRENVPEQYKHYAVRIGNTIDVYWHALMSKLFDQRGYWSRMATKRFLKWADEYNPNLLWLHNIHDYFINIEMLFNWIKSRPNMKIIWTQHDCWAFTGGCMYFTAANCYGWKTDCEKCPAQKSFLPIIKSEKKNFQKKKQLFTGISNMTLVTPSEWLADLVKNSFLKEYQVSVVNNRIDTDVFIPTPSDFRKRYNLENKKIVLGVAAIWTSRKGLDDFINLSKLLDDSYCIVLVGLSKKQIKALPKNIIGISRTNNAIELAEIYTAADVFVNPTYEDNYPTTNLEAQSCGTPCITYNTGGSPESVPNENVIEVGNIEKLKRRIEELLS